MCPIVFRCVRRMVTPLRHFGMHFIGTIKGALKISNKPFRRPFHFAQPCERHAHVSGAAHGGTVEQIASQIFFVGHVSFRLFGG
jgi:hypothetical protein